jgi:hypothetical protein
VALQWNWLPKQFGMADGAAYARLLDAQSEVHDLVAREVTQNSWDAARRHQAELAVSQGPEAAEKAKFRISYDFKNVKGEDKTRILNALNVNSLSDVLKKHGHGTLKFENGKTVLDRVAPNEELSLLYINDYGATGLRGDPVGEGLADSDFFRAFGQIGGNDRDEGGGSFGFGKSAFIKASRIRCVIAYSSFFPQGEDKVTRRLWGFVYWPSFGNKNGVAQLGLLQNEGGISSAPAVDKLADAMADSFGFNIRNANSFEECGTSLLIVDHVLDPHLLKDSLEKWWWPAMETHRGTFDVSVRTSDEVLRPQPLLNKSVKPYIRAFEIAQDVNAQLKDGEHKPKWRAIRDQGVSAGDLAIIRVEADGDNSPEDGLYAHIALIRSPRMVVNYLGFNGSTPNTEIKGVYLASADADPFLRKSEPASHDRWDTHIDESYGPDWEKTGKIVQSISKRIRDEVSSFQNSLRQTPKRNQSPLAWANELFAQLFSEPAKSGKKKSEEEKKKKNRRQSPLYDTTLVSRDRRMIGNGRISVGETWLLNLSDEVQEAVPVLVDFAAWVLADGNEASSTDRLDIDDFAVPTGFVQKQDGSIVGMLSPGKKYEFRFATAQYDQDWNLRTDLTVHIQQNDEASVIEEGSK